MSAATQSVARSRRSIPARAGIGLRAQYHEELLRDKPAIAWLEAHSENYFADGGGQIELLMQLRAHYPLSLHGVGLSLGGTDPLDLDHLWRLKRLIEMSEPGLVSEHVCWGSAGGIHTNDLLPLPYTQQALQHLIGRVSRVQDYLGREILLENVSSYLQFTAADFTEWEFLASLCAATGAGLLLDVNNVYVSSRNHGFDARHFIRSLPVSLVREIHLAGHTVKRIENHDILIDTHSAPVCDEVWDLYMIAIARFGRVPTLIEWDADLPPLEVLLQESAQAQRILDARHDLAA